MNPSTESLPSNDTLNYLLGRVARCEEQALDALYDLTSRRSFAIALKILRTRELAEEATFDGYTKVWDRARQFDARMGSARVWIDTIVRNCALDLLRKEKRRPHGVELGEDSPVMPVQETFGQQFEQSQLVGVLMKALSEEQRQVIFAAYYQGMTHSQIAKALHQPLGTVKTRIRNGLSVLREEIDKIRGASSP